MADYKFTRTEHKNLDIKRMCMNISQYRNGKRCSVESHNTYHISTGSRVSPIYTHLVKTIANAAI